jgi:uncharacterized membrane protein
MQHRHDHPPVRNINEAHEEIRSRGDRVADGFARVMGSWKFIITQSIILVFWVTLNAIAWANRWDPYPFILLNLALSFQAAYAAPIIMMSQNRQATKDRLMAENDYSTNVKAEDEVKQIMLHLEKQDEFLASLQSQLIEHLLSIREKVAEEGGSPPGARA